jgi:hypothetical protein
LILTLLIWMTRKLLRSMSCIRVRFSGLNDFDWPAVVGALTAVAVGLALGGIWLEKRKKSREREQLLLQEFYKRIGLIRETASQALRRLRDYPPEYQVAVNTALPALKRNADRLITRFHDDGHLITDRGNYRLIVDAVARVTALNDLDVIGVTTLQMIDLELGEILKAWKGTFLRI